MEKWASSWMVGEHTLDSLLFAEDQIIFVHDQYDIEYMLRKIKEEYTEGRLNSLIKQNAYI